MVYLVQLTDGLNENGAGRRLVDCEILKSIVKKVTEHHNNLEVRVLYCDDGAAGRLDLDTSVEAKVLSRLIKHWLPSISLIHYSIFSFHNENAVQLLADADIFYFKGFGGDIQQLLPIFGQSCSREMRERVREFHDRLIFNRMLAFMVCGAAVLCGTHYPGEQRLKGLRLLGDAYVHYHACETTSNILVSSDRYRIHLAPGVANIIRCDDGCTQVHCACVGTKRPMSYEVFRKENTTHLLWVMGVHALIWRIFRWIRNSGTVYWWACRTDGRWFEGDSLEDVLARIDRPESFLCIEQKELLL